MKKIYWGALLVSLLFLSVVLGMPAFATQKNTHKTYTNSEYGFSFKYLAGIEAGNAIDHTDGYIPDMAYFQTQGYPGLEDVYKKAFFARILVYKNYSKSLTDAVKDEFRNVTAQKITSKRNITIYGVKGIAIRIDYNGKERADTHAFETYFLKKGTTLYKILGITNYYPPAIQHIKSFESIMSSFRFKK